MTVTVPLRELGDRYLFQQFTPLGKESRDAIKIIVRGEGCYVFDSEGHSYLDAASGHFCVNVGHGRPEFAEAASAQFAQIAYWSNWGYASPPAILLASRLAEIAPGDLNRTFLTSGGSEAVESALKLARQFHRLAGEGSRTKVISRINAYHGTSLGALAATGVTSARSPFEPVRGLARSRGSGP